MSNPIKNNSIQIFFKTVKNMIPVFATKNETILETAHKNKIDLEGACEGSLACSTCHVILDRDLYNILELPSDKEYDLLDQAIGLKSTSRLGCQLKVDEKFNNKIIELPKYSKNMAIDGYVPKHH